MQQPKYEILGIGNALVDVVSQVDDSFLKDHGLVKGAMTLINAERADDLYAKMPSTIECSGGSVANTMVGLSMLGSTVAYIGKVKQDPLGEVFIKDIRSNRVEFSLNAFPSGPGTGRCMVFVTPDAQRTMQTYLGASATLSPSDIDPLVVESAGILYLEGYLFDPPPAKQAFFKAAEMAHRFGSKVALSLSDSFCVDRHRDDFQKLVEQHVDVLFANESEANSLYQTVDLQEAIDRIANYCELTAITLGEKGSVVVSKEKVWEVPSKEVDDVVDTTGAGDLYASGFLYGLVKGRDPAACAELGSKTAAEIVKQIGARPHNLLKNLVKEG